MDNIKNSIKEYLKCMNSFPYFCETYLRISEPETYRTKPFILNKNQKKFVEMIYDKSITDIYNIYTIEGDRQVGITSLMCAYFSWKIIFFENVRISLLSNSHYNSERILTLINNFITDLPFFLKPNKGKVFEKNRKSWKTINGLNVVEIRDLTNLGYKDMKATEIFMDNVIDEDFFKDSVFNANSKLYVVSTDEQNSSLIENLSKSTETYSLKMRKEENKTIKKSSLSNGEKLNLIKKILEQ